MPREHVEFIQAQSLLWEDDPRFSGAQRKLLSEDGESGAATQLQRFPKGFTDLSETALACNEEFFVLAGSFYLNNFEYATGAYAFYPAGYQRTKFYVTEETIMLRFFDHAPVDAAGDPEGTKERSENRPAISFLDSFRMNWDHSIHDIRLAHLGLARKVLRIDPVTEQRTFLFMTSPQCHPTNFRGPQESHPTVEEAYQIEGDLTGHLGTMYAGAYFWRPPHIPHGPYGTRGGSLSLIRFVEGPHVNIWSDETLPFHYGQSYTPILPESMQGAEPLPPTSNY